MKSNQLVLFILLVCVSVSTGFLAKLFWERMTVPAATATVSRPSPTPKPTEELPRPEVSLSQESGPVTVNAPTELNGKTRQEIYALRTQYVKNSIFDVPGYTPSEAVYGQIDDTRPWIAVTACRWPADGAMPTNGPSEESRFINNPSILIAVEQSWLLTDDQKPSVLSQHYGKNFCTIPETNFIPKHVYYDAQAKEITVVYPKPKVYITSAKNMYLFNGKNARDLGFAYAYLDLSQSESKIAFAQPDNISNQVYKFRDFIHVGHACSVPGGCNNGSPSQPELDFNSRFNQETAPFLYFKLWRNRPSSPDDPADITERIIFE